MALLFPELARCILNLLPQTHVPLFSGPQSGHDLRRRRTFGRDVDDDDDGDGHPRGAAVSVSAVMKNAEFV